MSVASPTTADPVIPSQEGTAIEVPKVIIEDNKPIIIKKVEERPLQVIDKIEDIPKEDIIKHRKVRTDKGKARKVIVKKITSSNTKGKKEKSIGVTTQLIKPKNNVGFKVGLSLGIIAGIFGAVFLYHYIKNRMKNKLIEKARDVVKDVATDHGVTTEEKPISELDRINDIYGNGVKSDMD